MEKLNPVQPSEHALTPEQLLCLASAPLREVVERLATGAAASRREIADRLGRPETTVQYQLARLRRAGLVVEAGRRPSDRRPEILYRLVAPRLSSAAATSSPEGRRALARSGGRIAAAAGRAFVRAVEADAPLSGPERRAAVRRLALSLDANGLAELNALIDRWTAQDAAGLTPGEIPVSLTLVLS